MKLAIIKDEKIDYCHDPPFHPSVSYPEYPFEGLSKENRCYEEVRNLLHDLGMDDQNYGTPSWNPFGDIIKPGDNVFLKPNMVTHKKAHRSIEQLITHGSVIRAVLDYAYIALKGHGRITIGDSPYIDTDFNSVLKFTGLKVIQGYYSKHSEMPLNIIDLRKEMGKLEIGGVKKKDLIGDPLGYSVLDLKGDSEHQGLDGHEKFRVTFYSKRETTSHHNRDKNEYYIANSVLDADIIINIPKLKTHGKSGITCALKNLVGINGYKGWLPHHRAGSSDEGGDEYIKKDSRKDIFIRLRDEIPDTDNALKKAFLKSLCSAIFASKLVFRYKDTSQGGSWYGNDTIPRTICDLNKILFYSDKKGILQDTQQRRMFVLVDGIVAGEKEGPMENHPRKCGVLIAGHNPVEVDLLCCLVMGFDYNKIPTFKYALNSRKYPLINGDISDIELLPDGINGLAEAYERYNCGLTPPSGWAGHIEYEKDKMADS
jgi:uncharacterized protein (DUF362 family)